MSEYKRTALVSVYAVSMAWVESAVVFYLRIMIHRMVPYQPDPLPNFDGLGTTETIREIATIVMLITVGLLAGRTKRGRAAYFLFAFGVWDICYYLFLIPLTGWPRSMLDWDVLFLLPLPWWGPVAAPLGISLLLIVGGGCITLWDTEESRLWPSRLARIAGGTGVVLAIYAFLQNSIFALGNGEEALRHMLPTSFPWVLFVTAYLLMLIPVLDLCRQTCHTLKERNVSQ